MALFKTRSSVKKGFTCLLAMVMLFSTFTGCSKEQKSVDAPSGNMAKEDKAKQENTKINNELNIAVFQGGYGREFWDELGKRFEEAYPGTKVNIEASPKIGELLRPKMLTGKVPDFILLSQEEKSGVTMGLIKGKEILDISDVFDSKALDHDETLRERINDGFLETKLCSPYGDGKVYLAPINYSPAGLWYNKNLFATKGWKVPETWDEFLALGDIAKEDERSLFTYQGIYPSYLGQIILTSIASKGGMEEINKVFKYEEGAWKTDAAKSTMNILKEIADKGYLLEGTTAMNHTQSQTEFLLGHALFVPNGSWFENEMKDAPREDGFEYGFLGVPTFEKEDTMYVNTHFLQMYIPKAAKNPDLAKEFIKFIYTDENIKMNAEMTKAVAPVKGALELCKPYLTDATYNSFMVYEQGARPLVGDFLPVPQGVSVEPVKQIYDPIASIMTQKMTVEEWANSIEETNAKVREAMK